MLAWDQFRARGSTHAARRILAGEGDDSMRRQAVYVVTRDVWILLDALEAAAAGSGKAADDARSHLDKIARRCNR